jgi:hypothetical protein
VVIKNRNPDDLIADLEETFSSLRRFRWKLNPTKCIFGVPSGKLSGSSLAIGELKPIQ